MFARIIIALLVSINHGHVNTTDETLLLSIVEKAWGRVVTCHTSGWDCKVGQYCKVRTEKDGQKAGDGRCSGCDEQGVQRLCKFLGDKDPNANGAVPIGRCAKAKKGEGYSCQIKCDKTTFRAHPFAKDQVFKD